MNENFGLGQMGYQQQAAVQGIRAHYQHETVAEQWAQAKTRLTLAIEASNAAQGELQEAQKAEQDAWTSLENQSGRGAPPSIGNKYPQRP